MKRYLLLFVLFLSAFQGRTQTKTFFDLVFSDSVMKNILIPAGMSADGPFTVIERGDQWSRERFFKMDESRQAYLYAYDDPIIEQLIEPKEWSMVAHIALSKYAGTFKQYNNRIKLIARHDVKKQGNYFSLSSPVIYRNLGVIDLRYYSLKDGNSLEQGLKGQALFVFRKDDHKVWHLERVVNNLLVD